MTEEDSVALFIEWSIDSDNETLFIKKHLSDDHTVKSESNHK